MCGGRLSAKSVIQHIYSHTKYGDANYGNGAECDWLIEAEGSHGLVHLQFVAFELEGKIKDRYRISSPPHSVDKIDGACLGWPLIERLENLSDSRARTLNVMCPLSVRGGHSDPCTKVLSRRLALNDKGNEHDNLSK